MGMFINAGKTKINKPFGNVYTTYKKGDLEEFIIQLWPKIQVISTETSPLNVSLPIEVTSCNSHGHVPVDGLVKHGSFIWFHRFHGIE